MLLGYNTNGFAHHRLEDAVELLAELGYRSVALSIDHGCLAPNDPRCEEQIAWLRAAAVRHALRYVVETGARYLLDPRRKHEPTMVSPDPATRAQRIDFYRHAIRLAAQLDAVAVSVWSGVVHDGASRAEAFRRLAASLDEVLGDAAEHGVTVALEPEPGMLVATLADYAELKHRLADQGIDAARLQLTIDIGHLHCNAEGSLPRLIAEHAAEIANVHIEDMRAGVHEHLMLGDGEIDFPPVINALVSAGYRGPLAVELSRHGHMAPDAAERSREFLRPLIEEATARNG